MEAGNFRGFELTLHDPGITLITFNQPERLNGMTQDMKRDLVETVLQAQMDEAVRVVVFTGRRRARAGRAARSARRVRARRWPR